MAYTMGSNNSELLTLLISNLEDSGKKETPSATMSTSIDRESQLPSPPTLLPEQGIKQRRRSRVIRNFSKIKEFCSISEFEIWLNEQKMWSVGTKNELKDRIIQNYRCKFSRKSKTDCMKSIRLIKYHNENTYILEESDNAHDHSIITISRKDFSEQSSDNDKKFSITDHSNVIQSTQLNQNNILVKILTKEDSPSPSSPSNIEDSIKKNREETVRIITDNKSPNYSYKTNQSNALIESQQKSYNFKDSPSQNVLFKLLKSEDNQISQKTSLISLSPSLSIRPQSAPVVVSSYRFVATFRDKATFQQWFSPISNEWMKKSKDYESDKSIKYFVCTYNVINSNIKKEHSSDNVNYCPAALRVTSYNLKDEILVEDSVERHNHGDRLEYNKTFGCQDSEYMGNVKKNSNVKIMIDNRSSSEEPLELSRNNKNKDENIYLSHHNMKSTKRRRTKRNKFKRLSNLCLSSIEEATEWLSVNEPSFKSHIRKIFNCNEQIYFICPMYGRGYTKCKKQYRIVHYFNDNSVYIEESVKSHNHKIHLNSIEKSS
uniref:FLYWCH-type domain-containing protein n=1 Tax=Strongyloides papillosus TaxID=174720 RepID=A0A0N5BXU0_STREA